MVGRLGIVSLLAAALAATASAGTTPDVQTKIVPGVSIGKIRIGMTLAAVKKVLGQPEAVIKDEARGFGRAYREYSWNLTEWRVGFEVSRGRALVVTIGTSNRRERTAQGIGVGIRAERLQKAHRVDCRTAWVPNTRTSIGTWCVGRERTGARTAYLLHSHCPRPSDRYCDVDALVTDIFEVRVFAAGQPLPVAFEPAPDPRGG